jgi:hypothetical protein
MKTILLEVTLFTMWFGTSAMAVEEQPKTLSLQAVRQCLAVGGKVHRMGLLQYERCERPMSDAGKVCNDSSQCKAGCFYENRSGTPVPSSRKKITGFCAATDTPFGCRSYVEHGRLGIGVCVD